MSSNTKIVQYELAYSHNIVRIVCKTDAEFKKAMDEFNSTCSIKDSLEIEEVGNG